MSKVSRAEIRDATITLFYQQGYHGTSMQDIAQAVGIKKASLYHHFKGKQELLLAILEEGLEHLIDPLETIIASDLSPEAKLRAAIRQHVVLIAEHPGVANIFLYVDQALEAEHRAYYIARRDAFEGLFRRVLVEGIETGDFRQTDVAVSAQALLGMVNWMTRWYRPQGALSAEELADTFADLFLCGQLESTHSGH